MELGFPHFFLPGSIQLKFSLKFYTLFSLYVQIIEVEFLEFSVLLCSVLSLVILLLLLLLLLLLHFYDRTHGNTAQRI